MEEQTDFNVPNLEPRREAVATRTGERCLTSFPATPAIWR